MVDIPSSHSGASARAFSCPETHLDAEATVKSWNQVYVGSAANCLYDTIRDHCVTKDPTIYARYAAILQSSGMGKSRTIDELSKEHFVIPINLRPSADTGLSRLAILSFCIIDSELSSRFPSSRRGRQDIS
jgi:hypothetical protein